MTNGNSGRANQRQSVLPPLDKKVLLSVLLGATLIFFLTWLGSRDFMPGARMFPTFVAALGAMVTVGAIIRVWLGIEPSIGPGQVLPDHHESSWPAYRFAVVVIGSISIYYLGILFIGFMPATFVYLVIFARLYKQSWRFALTGGFVALGLVYGMSLVLGLYLPWGRFFEGMF